MKQLYLVGFLLLLNLSLEAQTICELYDPVFNAVGKGKYKKAEPILLNILQLKVNENNPNELVCYGYAHYDLGLIYSDEKYEKFDVKIAYNYFLQSISILEKAKSISLKATDDANLVIGFANEEMEDLLKNYPALSTAIVSSNSSAVNSNQNTEPNTQQNGKPIVSSISPAVNSNQNTEPNTQQNDKTVTLVVSAQGKTQDEAKQNALRSAIEQAFGAFISSKTEILNDQVVADQMASVSSGNIQSYEMLNESQLPDGSWGLTLKALVSVDKLTSFVEAKGIAIEIKGGLFALNIKQQLLNEQGEIKAVNEMVGLLHEPMQTSFDYVIKSSDPKSLDAESKNWEIPLVVTATTNKNMDFCANYCIKTLAALSLSSEEVTSYTSLNKAVFPVVINYNGVTKTFYLRKQSSINALNTFISNWEFYTRLFTVQSGMDESNGNGKGQVYELDGGSRRGNGSINFLTTGQQAATFTWQDKRTLSQIEQMTGYKVKPRGVVSQFKHGGFVVYEKNGHGLVAAITDLRKMDWKTAKTACDELILNGYNDWHLPSKDELDLLYVKLKQLKVGGFADSPYWSILDRASFEKLCFDYLGNGCPTIIDDFYKRELNVRAVRTF